MSWRNFLRFAGFGGARKISDRATGVDAKVALLIDVDNIVRVSGANVDDIFKTADSYGSVIVGRAYGARESFGRIGSKWSFETLHRYAIRPIICPVYVKGKNTTDITLMIEAMELAHQKIVNIVCIATNDSDFVPLATKLPEHGIKVYVMGGKHAHKDLVKSCVNFIRLDLKSEEAKSDRKNPNSNKSAADAKKAANGDLVKNLKDACAHYGDEEGWMFMAMAGEYLRRIDPGFSPQNYGYAKFKKLLESMDAFEIDENKNAPSYPKIRIKDAPK